jgi:hypothetical protein
MTGTGHDAGEAKDRCALLAYQEAARREHPMAENWHRRIAPERPLTSALLALM